MLSEEDLVAEGILSAISGSQDGTWRSRTRPSLSRKSGKFSNPFKMDKEAVEVLTELLNQYTQNGIPELPGLLTFKNSGDSQNDPYILENHWSDIVDGAQDFSKRKRNQQDAIWELLQTEVFYIRRVKVITMFLSVLCNLQNECILNEIDTEKIFSNVRDIYAANQAFWTDHLLPMLNETRATHQPFNPLFMKDGFLHFDKIFHPYVKYCLDQNACLLYVKEKHKDNELFKIFVTWCGSQKECDRLTLVDLLVKPMQRLTKYSLILKAVHKKTENQEHKRALIEMNECVENFVCGVDAILRQRYEQERLASIISRIESYDAIDCNNDELEKALKDHCNLDLTCPMPGCGNQQSRHLLLEGSGLKLRDTSSSKVDVHCFLFTDMLLICKAVGKKGDKVRVIRQPYIADRLEVQELKDGSGLLIIYLNEFKVASAAFILYTAETKQWAESIQKAQEQYRKAKAAAAALEKTDLSFLPAADEDEDCDSPSVALLVARSPYSSSRSSLAHSHSGSVDMNESSSSTGIQSSASSCGQSQPKAVSIELGELRNPSLTADDPNERVRARSVETWMSNPVSVTVTSPRPERRAFFLKGAGANAQSSNTLSVSSPFQMGDIPEQWENNNHHSPPSIQVPITPPVGKNLSLVSQASHSFLSLGNLHQSTICTKPPLLKTKNVGLLPHSAPQSKGPSPIQSFESDTTIVGGLSPPSDDCPSTTTPDSDEESRHKKISLKRISRSDHRYHTADSIENIKKEKDSNIHKRLSWNYGQQSSGSMTSSTGESGFASVSEKLMGHKHVAQCLSSESVYSSSGVSSTGSLPPSSGSTDNDAGFEGSDIVEEQSNLECDISDEKIHNEQCKECSGDFQCPLSTFEADGCKSRQMMVGPPGSSIKIDISEVKDGISSVQISENGSHLSHSRSSKVDLRRMKEFLLTSCSVESSEV